MRISELKPMTHRVRFHSDDVVGGYVSKGLHEATVIDVESEGLNQWAIRTPGCWHKVHFTDFEYEIVEDEILSELETKPLPIPCRQTLVNKRSID